MLLPRPGKAYVRPETTRPRTYAGIEDIIEVRLAHTHSSMCLICTQVLNDIHEVIIDKVSGRFVNVKKDVRLGRYAMLKDAADDFRAMQQERCALDCLQAIQKFIITQPRALRGDFWFAGGVCGPLPYDDR